LEKRKTMQNCRSIGGEGAGATGLESGHG